MAPQLDCSSAIKPATYKTRLLIEADSLLYRGYYDAAKVKYNKIRNTMPRSEEAKNAQFSLAYSNVFYKNSNADWNEGLKEFKTFAELYPKDPRIGEVLSWIRILTVIQSYDGDFRTASTQVERLKSFKNEVREARLTQRVSLDSLAFLLRGAYESRDSLARKNSDLENVIIALEKKCQQAGR